MINLLNARISALTFFTTADLVCFVLTVLYALVINKYLLYIHFLFDLMNFSLLYLLQLNRLIHEKWLFYYQFCAFFRKSKGHARFCLILS